MDEEPEWHLLPHDPIGFFGLGPSFDRKDLKRSYNRWLRRFKPEKFPDEFQRLRAAYETLDDRLRYLAESGAAVPERPVAFAQPESELPEPTRAEVPAGPDFEQTLREQGPEAAFEQLLSSQSRLPLDVFRLAILSDVVNSTDNRTFADWLVEGLREWRSSKELRELLYAYCHRPEALQHAPELLLQLTAVGDPGLYGYLTERLWRRHAENAPFQKVAKLFERCRRELDADSHHAVHQLSFVMFRCCLFAADEDWLEEEWRRLLEAGMVGDGDIVEMMFEYRLEREDFLDGSAARAAIDRVVRAVASGDIVRADRAFLAMQLELGALGPQLLTAFPTGDRDWFMAQAILGCQSAERADRHDESDTPKPSDTEIRTRTTKLVRKLGRLSIRSKSGILWAAALIALVLGAPLLAVALGVWFWKSMDPA